MVKKRKKTNWKQSTERFVVFFDILGFKELVIQNEHEYVYSLLSKISDMKNYIESVGELPDRYFNSEIYTASFSDSIILFSKDNSPECFDLITYSSTYLLSEAIQLGIPLRAAMSLGKMSINKSNQIYFGKPLIDAYLLEEDLYYYGIIADSTIDEFVKKSYQNLDSENLYFKCNTPLKSRSITMTNINWFNDLTDTSRNVDKQYYQRIEKRFYDLMQVFESKTSGRPRKYVDNTTYVFEQLTKNSLLYNARIK